MDTDDKIREELKLVFDPEFGVNIVDLGYVYEIEIKNDNQVIIKMTCISENASIRDWLSSGVKFAIQGIDGIKDVDVQFVTTPKWSPSRMNKEVRKN